MPKVTLNLGGQTHEVEFTPEDFARYVQQFGLNGHHSSGTLPIAAPAETKRRGRPPAPEKQSTDFAAFEAELSDNPRQCLHAIRLHPEGIDSHALAKSLNLKGPEQLGGIFGPGIKMLADKHGIKVRDIYKTKVTFKDKVRKRMFYPCKLLLEGQK